MSTLHQRKVWVHGGVGCLLLLSATACAHQSSTERSIFAERVRLADAIASVDHADAGWVAAMYVFKSDGPRAQKLLQRSAAALPNDPVVAFAALRVCVNLSSCDVAAAARTLRRADPDNGFSELPELESALSAGDEARVEAALREMSRRPGWRLYWNQAVTRATAVHVMAARALPPADARELADETASHAAATGVMAGMLVPAYRPLASACAVDRRSERQAICEQISRGLQRGDAVITQSIGYSMELKLTSPGSPEHDAATQGRRDLTWLLQSQEPATASPADQFRQLQATLDREEDVLREMLRRHGKASEPPAGWNPTAG